MKTLTNWTFPWDLTPAQKRAIKQFQIKAVIAVSIAVSPLMLEAFVFGRAGLFVGDLRVFFSALLLSWLILFALNRIWVTPKPYVGLKED